MEGMEEGADQAPKSGMGEYSCVEHLNMIVNSAGQIYKSCENEYADKGDLAQRLQAAAEEIAGMAGQMIQEINQVAEDGPPEPSAPPVQS